MQELKSLETAVLIDLLSSHSAEYSKKLNAGTIVHELDKLKLTIKAIQLEIQSRKQTSDNTTTTDPEIILPDN